MVAFSVSALIRTVVEKRLDAFSSQPPFDQTEEPAEEPKPTDIEPQVAIETDADDQPVTEEKETEKLVAEAQRPRRISFMLHDSDQAETEDLETE